MSYLRRLQISCLLYIDDRLVERFVGVLKKPEYNNSFGRALIAVYCVAQVVSRLGYFIGLQKSQLIPVQVIEFLGACINVEEQIFMFPERKRASFALLREYLLSQQSVTLRTMQRFVGKCISLLLMVPAAKLYTAEANITLSQYSQGHSRIPILGSLKEEISHWKFMDTWTTGCSWLRERHYVIGLASDASSYRWGASVSLHGEVADPKVLA